MKKLGIKRKAGAPKTKRKSPSVKALYTIVSDNSWTEDAEYPSMKQMLDDIDFEDENGFNFKVKYSNEDATRNVSFCLQWEHTYCCGCGEIGELSLDVAALGPMNALFSKLFDDFNNKTFTLTTIPEQVNWETYLEKSNLFKKVKEFVNANTDNTVTLWVSDN